jgi:TorA maturation chaperone TorD
VPIEYFRQTSLPLSRTRGGFYGLLSRLYLEIPDRSLFELDMQPVEALAALPRNEGQEAIQKIGQGLSLIRTYLSRQPFLEETELRNLTKDWTRLFRGVEKKGMLPPYESFYRPETLPEKSAQEIHRLFAEMGIHVPEEWHQPPDYIGVELDFMRLLCGKEEQAWERGKPTSALEVLELERSFLDTHLGLWIPSFCARMVAEAREEFYRGVARLTIGLVEYDRAYLPQGRP